MGYRVDGRLRNIVKYLVKTLIISSIFYALAKIGLYTAFLQSNVTLFWLPSGLSLAVILILGKIYWLGISLGALAANYSSDTPNFFIFAAVVSNTIEPILTRFLLSKNNFNPAFPKIRDVLFYILYGVFLSPLFSALLGSSGLYFSGMISEDKILEAFLSWWAGNAFGVLTFGSLVLVWSQNTPIQFNLKKILEVSFTFLFCSTIHFLIYFDILIYLPIKYLSWFIFPILVWFSTKYSLRASVTLAFTIIVISVFGTITNRGPFYTGQIGNSLFLLYSFISVIMINTLILSVVTAERISKEIRIQTLYDQLTSTHKSLQKNEEQLRLALNGGDLGLWDWNFQTGSLEVNERWMTMLGLDPQKATPTIQLWSSIVHPEDNIKLDKIIQEEILNPNGKNFELEIRALHKDGNYIWILDKGAVVERDNNGNPIRISGTHLDITNRVEAEKSLHQTEQKFRDLVYSTEGIVWEANASNLKFESVSENAERILGYSISEWLEDDFWVNHIYPEDREETVKNCILCTRQNKDHDFEYRFVAKDGRIVWLRDIVKVVIENGEAKYLRGIMIDITRNKDSSQILDLREKSLGAISQGVLLTDVDRKITYANNAFETITGYNEKEILGKTCAFLQGKDTNPQTIDEIRNAIQNKLPIQVEILNYRKDGSYFWNELSISPVFDSRGKLIQFVGVQKDITAEKLAKLELFNAMEEAKEASRIKSDFLNNMSHEIRTPLNAVIGYSDLLLKTNLDEAQSNFLNRVITSSNSLLELLNSILEFSNISSGKTKIQISEVNLKELIEQILKDFSSKSISKNIKTFITLDSNIPKLIYTDQYYLKNILTNIISNAFKFTDSGEIEIQVKVNTHLPEENTINLLFWIRDTGIGISEEDQIHIFDSFSQVDYSMSRKYGGAGLGLTIANELLKQLHSKIEIKSEIGKGSVFYFNLNVLTQKSDFTISNESKEDKFENMTLFLNPYCILVVDDDPINLELIKAIIKLILPNVILLEAVNGSEAIDKFVKGNPDLVLLDIQMPEMNGYEVSRAIRNLEKGIQKPIIAITAGTDVGNKEKCLDSGMNDYVNKPVTKSKITELILFWLLNQKL